MPREALITNARAIHEANAASWDMAASGSYAGNRARKVALLAGGRDTFEEIERRSLRELIGTNTDALHLQCADGGQVPELV